MNDAFMLLAMREMLYYTMSAVAVISVPMLIVGIIFSVLQAATQINEMTITFIPKLMVMFSLLFFLSPWMMESLVLLTQKLLTNLPQYIH